jgi:predicted kinase
VKKSSLKILILIGIPASGKSTWAKEYVRKHENWVRVNRDMFRLMLKDAQMCEPKIEDMITSLMYSTIETSLMRKQNIIIDNTNLKQKYLDEIIERFKYTADIEYQLFDISLNKAIERDNARESKVGEGVIRKMYEDYKRLIDGMDFQPIKKIENRPVVSADFSSKLPHAVIFDIDGTLAHMKNRGAFDWKKVDRDEVNQIVAEQVDFHRIKGRKILLVSGRDAICRNETIEWLNFYGIHFDELLMRPEGDYRKDTIIKREIYQNQIQGKYNVLSVYDDRLQVLDMWYEEGIFTFNVNQGQINF